MYCIYCICYRYTNTRTNTCDKLQPNTSKKRTHHRPRIAPSFPLLPTAHLPHRRCSRITQGTAIDIEVEVEVEIEMDIPLLCSCF